MSDVVQGACVCEGVKFFVTGTPDSVFICYCTHCSKNAGGPGQIFAATGVHISEGEGLLKTWVMKDNLSGCDKHKVFCGRCGCTLWTVPMKHNGSHWIVRTSLLEDGLERFPFTAEFFATRKVSVSHGLIKSFATMPGA